MKHKHADLIHAWADGNCQTVFDFNTGKYTKICCYPDGRCTVYTF